jgi:hypothetical protein
VHDDPEGLIDCDTEFFETSDTSQQGVAAAPAVRDYFVLGLVDGELKPHIPIKAIRISLRQNIFR